MEFVIKSIAGRTLYTCDAETLRGAVERAVAENTDLGGANLARAYLAGADLGGANLARANLAGAYLDGANLAGAYLGGANLARAYLAGADLARANLAGANLAGAYLDGANLAGAYLGGADLGGANLDGATKADWLAQYRDDLRAVLDAAPNEVEGLAAAIRAGKVDGSAYEGECACLLGTIANVRHCGYRALGITPDSDRPAERWFMRIRPGHTPTSSVDAALALAWIEEWRRDRAGASDGVRVVAP